MLAAMVGCNDTEPMDQTPERPRFRIEESIEGLSRTPQLDQNGAGRFSDGDRNTLFFHAPGDDRFTTFAYTYGQVYYWNDLALPEGADRVVVAACYPEVETSSPRSFEWNTLQNNDKDLLLGISSEVRPNDGQAVAIPFRHALHKLDVELEADGKTITGEELANASVVCRKFLPVAVVDLLEARTTGATGSLAELEGKGARTGFVVPAQMVGEMELEVSLGRIRKVFRFADFEVGGVKLTELKSGSRFAVKLRVSKSTFTVVDQNIAGWDDQGQVEDSIII